MRTLFTSTFVAIAAAALTGTTASAQIRGLVSVNIQPAAAVPVVLLEGAGAGRTLVTTGRDGKGSFNIADIANASKMDVVEEKCASATRILLVAEGESGSASNNCRRRRVGAFWWGHDEALNVKLSGMSTATKAMLAGAGAGGAFLAKETLGGSKTEVRRQEPQRQEPQRQEPQRQEPPRQEPPREEPRVVTFDGTYRILATKVSDGGCNFVPSFSGQLQVTSTGDSRVTVRMIERLTRVYSGAVQQVGIGSLSATGSGSLSTLTYTGQLVAQVNGNSISGTETLNIQNGCQKQVVYSFAGSK